MATTKTSEQLKNNKQITDYKKRKNRNKNIMPFPMCWLKIGRETKNDEDLLHNFIILCQVSIYTEKKRKNHAIPAQLTLFELK